MRAALVELQSKHEQGKVKKHQGHWNKIVKEQAATLKDWHAAVQKAALLKLWQSEWRDLEVDGWRKWKML